MNANSARSGRGLDRTLGGALLALAGALVLFEVTDLDLIVQDRLYDFAQGRWWVDAQAAGPRLWFYDGPKIVLILFAVSVLAWALGPERWRARLPAGSRRDLLVLLATLASGPALVGLGKATTDVFCPSEVRRYGGDVAYVKLCGTFAEGDRPARRGHCFPAGHASGGFALVALAGLARTRRGRALGLAVGLVAGSWMGGYQMAKGAHYLSHTLVTLLISWILFLVWRRVLRARGASADGEKELLTAVRVL